MYKIGEDESIRPISLELLRDVVPKAKKSLITQGLVDTINDINSEPELAGIFKDNIIGYTDVLKDGKYKMKDYINAVKWVSLKSLGSSDINAYAKVFPDRYQDKIDRGLDKNQIAPYASEYKTNSKLVNAIIEQTLIPTHILNAPLFQEALNQAALLMYTAKSEMAKAQAINTILQYTKQPEVSKIELDMNVKDTSEITDLRAEINRLSEIQYNEIKSGNVTAKQIAHSSIVSKEKEEILDGEVE